MAGLSVNGLICKPSANACSCQLQYGLPMLREELSASSNTCFYVLMRCYEEHLFSTLIEKRKVVRAVKTNIEFSIFDEAPCLISDKTKYILYYFQKFHMTTNEYFLTLMLLVAK